jgi:periplasmic divalent cation tolerance protein
MKTTADRLERLQQVVVELHSYDTPEGLYWPATASPPYGRWAMQVFSSNGR